VAVWESSRPAGSRVAAKVATLVCPAASPFMNHRACQRGVARRGSQRAKRQKTRARVREPPHSPSATAPRARDRQPQGACHRAAGALGRAWALLGARGPCLASPPQPKLWKHLWLFVDKFRLGGCAGSCVRDRDPPCPRRPQGSMENPQRTPAAPWVL